MQNEVDMKDFKIAAEKLLSSNMPEQTISEFRKLIGFVDTSISAAFSAPEDQKMGVLLNSLSNLKNYMASELNGHVLRSQLKDGVLRLYEEALLEEDKSEVKKKELDSQILPEPVENLSETDR